MKQVKAKTFLASSIIFSVGIASPLLATHSQSLASILEPSLSGGSGICDSFTGEYKDLGTGIIVNIGSSKVVVYNGSTTPLDGKCLNSNEIEVNFPSGTLIGSKSGSDISWSNGRNWSRTPIQ